MKRMNSSLMTHYTSSSQLERFKSFLNTDTSGLIYLTTELNLDRRHLKSKKILVTLLLSLRVKRIPILLSLL